MLYFLAFCNAIIILTFLYSNRNNIQTFTARRIDVLKLKVQDLFGVFILMDITGIYSPIWTYGIGSFTINSSFLYTSTLNMGSGMTIMANTTNNQTISAPNLIFSNHSSEISLTSVIEMREILGRLEKDFHETKIKQAIQINELKENKEK